MIAIHDIYRARCLEIGDVNDHLPLLNYLSRKSTGVVEFGVSHGVSTTALIDGQTPSGWYEGYDINKECSAIIGRLKAASGIDARFINQASTAVELTRSPDFLFIDSLHAEEVVAKELALHMNKIGKYIAFHDTVTFGEVGEVPGTRGILYGMGLISASEQWRVCYDSPRNNGLVVFERQP